MMHDMSDDTTPTPRRPMTAAEAKALGHPTRLRILFACREEGRTTKQLADALGVSPGTIHHHLQPLVEQGFLAALEPRRGARGSREQPYRATGRSWEVSATAASTEALRSVAAEELLGAGPEDLVVLARLGLWLRPAELQEVAAELQALVDDLAASQRRRSEEVAGGAPDGDDREHVRLLLAITRERPGAN